MARGCSVLLLLGCWLVATAAGQNATENEIRPYEFTFNIADFQHRSERKGDDGLITGEYGFITADGIYHETAYATDKSGDFVITKMKHRKIASLKDAEEIFKDDPRRAKQLAEALGTPCAAAAAEGCEPGDELDRQETGSFARAAAAVSRASEASSTPRNTEEAAPRRRLERKLDLAAKEMMRVLSKTAEGEGPDKAAGPAQKPGESPEGPAAERSAKDLPPQSGGPSSGPASAAAAAATIREMVAAARNAVLQLAEGPAGGELEGEALERMASELFYRFNYTLGSHGHWEDGFHGGRKDGEYRAKFAEGVDARVKYVSNEFGHQPNITLVPRPMSGAGPGEDVGAGRGGEAAENNGEGLESGGGAAKVEVVASGGGGHYFNWFRK